MPTYEFTNPFVRESDVEEPPKGTVIAYQLKMRGQIYDYVSFRAGSGNWYTTGSRRMVSNDWPALWRMICELRVGPVRYASAWGELDLPTDTSDDDFEEV